MATASTIPMPTVPVGEYLGSIYRPDVDYVDGVLEERNVGEIDHADLQYALLMALARYWESDGIRARLELRVQITPTKFRVPDVCVLPAGWKRTSIFRVAPLLCIEVLSPRDNIMRTRNKAKEYLRLGVGEVWIFDPQTRSVYVLNASGMTEQNGGLLHLQNTPIQLDVDAIFLTLDQ